MIVFIQIIHFVIRKVHKVSIIFIIKFIFARIKILRADGWYEVSCVGDHHQYKHPIKLGKVTIPHPNKDLPQRTVKSIFKQAGIKLN